jgi:uncharacterized protein (TIGR03067 family)
MRATLLCPPLLLLLSLPAACPGGGAAKKAPAELQGTWKVISLELGGKSLDVSRGQPPWVIRGNKVLRAGEELAVLTAHAGTKPRALDLKLHHPDRVYEGIYAVDGGTLKICVQVQTEGVRERPVRFSTKDQPRCRTLVFERLGRGEEAEEAAGFVGIQIRKDKDRIVIADLIQNSPARKGGLKKDDVLLRIGGEVPADLQAAVQAVRDVRPGSDLAFRVRRGGKERDVTVRVGVVPFFLLDD